MSTISKKLMSILLVLALLVSSVVSGNTVFAEEEENESTGLSWEVVENDKQRAADKLKKLENTPEDDVLNIKGDVRVSIVLEGGSTLDQGFSTKTVAEDPSAIAYRDSLKNQQDQMAATISKEVLGGKELDVVWNLTLAANIISANVPADKIYAIRDLQGVKDVVLETQYYPETTFANPDDPNMTVATGMTTVNYAWAAGYSGAGSKVAIVDTGLDLDHQSFDPVAFQYSIDQSELKNGTEYALMTKKDVLRFWNSLNASQYGGSAEEAYRNAKVPFAFNYVDMDFDVTHLNDTQGEHGSHVAGIATANKYLYVGGESGNSALAESYTTAKTIGNAPDAQVLVMKVFGRGGGAYDSDYFSAIEDAIVLGADSVNLSLGSSAAGFARNSTYQEIIDSLVDVNIVWANSAGNNGSWADQTPYGYLYAGAGTFATGGSPATYANTLSTASVDNDGFTGAYLVYNDEWIFYTETSGYGNAKMTTAAGTYEYVFVDGPGVDDNDHVGMDGDTFYALGEDVLEGKIAICYRGTSSFFAKGNAAAAQGAAAVIIGNNTSGTISMNLTGYKYSVPVVSITQADADLIKTSSKLVETDTGLEYYTGTIEISEAIDVTHYDQDYYQMSDFSGYGVPGDLSLKPEITAPGGNIYSVFGLNRNTSGELVGGHDQYENMSGTSMASPQMAGIVAVMAQYVRENGLDEKAQQLGITRRALIQSLLMSTSMPLIEEESGSFYSVMKQGSGLADVEAAINSNIVVLMNETKVNGESRKDISSYAKDGKVKAELGDDPDRSGKYSVEFTLNNITDQGLLYDLDGYFFTQDLYYFLLDTWTVGLNPSIEWFVDGERFVNEEVGFDFNGDGSFDNKDAQAILDYVAGLTDTLNDIDYADLDGDGQITTRDAYEALKLANQGAAYIPANGTVTVRAEIDLSQELPYVDVNGAYVEGYLVASERDSKDGAIGVVHTIPVLGYYGNWSEPSMIDIGSYVKYDYGLENNPPYMYVSSALDKNALYNQALIGYSKDLNTSYVLEGNPLGAYYDDGVYHSERNAFNSNNTIAAAQYTLIRNANAVQFKLVDAEGETVKEGESIGNMYAAYYYPSDGKWKNTSTSMTFNLTPSSLEEGDTAQFQFYLAPEYYVNNGAVDWDNVPPTWLYDFVVDNSAPEITKITGERIVEESAGTGEEGEEATVTETIKIDVEASDNEYIAGMFVYQEDDTLVYEKGSRADQKTEERDNQKYEIELDGKDVSDHLYIEVWDYAGNLMTVRINLNKEELEQPISISLDEEYVKTVINSPYKLNATVSPWGTEDQEVIWSSSDESIAVVSENGVVTGLETGEAVITATAHADPEKSASCAFEFVKIERTLKGFVWDEEGQVWLSEFNTAKLPDYDKLSGSLKLPLASATYAEDGLLYAASLNTSDFVSSLYLIDENTFEATMIGSTDAAYMDICAAPNLLGGTLIGVNGQYLLVIDKTTGDYLGAVDLSDSLNNNYLVGIAFDESYDYTPRYGCWGDWIWLLDTAGNLYQTGFLADGRMFVVSPLGSLGYSTDTSYFQSLYFDGTDLYWSRYVEAYNKVDIIFVSDIYNAEDGTIYNLGSFADGVWPVGGLYNDNLKELIGVENSRHADAEIDPNAVLETEIAPIHFNSNVNKGVLDSFDGTGNSKLFSKEDIKTVVEENDDSDSAIMTIDLVVDQDGVTNNGLYEVTYDSDVLEFKYVATKLPYHAINDKVAGKVVFAFADLDGIAADEVIARVVFERIDTARTSVSVAEKESNGEIDHDADPEEITFKDPTEDFGDILPEDQPETEAEIPEGIWISKLTDLEYTGSALTQDFRVYHYKKLLTKGVDYTVKYKNNKKAGTATVTVTGKGNYKDTVSKTFTIYPAQLNEENTVVILNKDAFAYNGKTQKAKVSSVMYNGKKLSSKNYSVAYENANSAEEGVYKITVSGKGNYSGEINVTYQISKDIVPVSSLKISGIGKKVYTGSEITQDVTVIDNVSEKGKAIPLYAGSDYTVAYKDNVNAGTAYVTITGLGKYVGSVTKTFTISGLKLTASNTTVSGLPESVRYCGEYEPEIQVNYGTAVLTEGKDYEVNFANNNKAGSATVTIKGIGNYSGSFKKKFSIEKISLDDVVSSNVKAQAYQKGGSKPNVELYDPFNNVALVLGKDYTLSYKNNAKIGLAKVTVKGKGNYSGTLVKEFEVKMANIAVLDAKAADKAYSSKKGGFKTTMTITDTNGKKLASGTDYEKTLVYTYVKDTVLNNSTIRQAGEEVGASDIIPADTEVRVTAKAKGKYTGEVSAVYRIVKASIAKAKVSIANQTYTGNEIQLDKAEMTVKVGSDTLKPEDFVIVSYANNVNKGKATVTIQGVGNYGGTKTATFKIVQKSFLNAIWALFQ